MLIEAPKSITVDGVEHPVDKFGETVQRLVSIHTAWRNDLQTERLAIAKTEAAIRTLDAELAQEVQKELNPPDEAANEETAEVVEPTQIKKVNKSNLRKTVMK